MKVLVRKVRKVRKVLGKIYTKTSIYFLTNNIKL